MLHDDIISTGLIMLIFFGGIMLVLGPNHFTSIKGGDIVSAYDPKKKCGLELMLYQQRCHLLFI